MLQLKYQNQHANTGGTTRATTSSAHNSHHSSEITIFLASHSKSLSFLPCVARKSSEFLIPFPPPYDPSPHAEACSLTHSFLQEERKRRRHEQDSASAALNTSPDLLTAQLSSHKERAPSHHAAFPPSPGTQFTGFTSTKVQILTQQHRRHHCQVASATVCTR